MATDEELRAIDERAFRDGTHTSALRAVYNAGLARALEIAREEKFVIARVAAAIEAERGQHA